MEEVVEEINMNLRNLCLKILEEIENDKKFINEVIDDYFYLYSLEPKEKAFINKIINGTTEYKIKLDYIINRFSKVKTDKLKKPILYILRMSVYQMLYLDFIPISAVINEAVKLTKKRKMINLAGFVNGVLREISRNLDTITYPDYSIYYSFPSWLFDYLVKQYNIEIIKEVLEDSLKIPKISIRPNRLKCTKEELIKALELENINFINGTLLDDALKLEATGMITKINAFKDGLFQIQDESSMLVGKIASPNSDDIVLDICAAPGGKTTHLAELMDNKGKIYSRDISDRKIALIEENCNRLGITNVILKKHDAILLDEELIDKVNVLIADVPCSGLGIIKKKPDIKYNVTLEGIENLIKIQRNILKTSSKYVKIGGSLIYSTCTINKEENHKNIEWFLNENKNFEIAPLDYSYPNQIKTDDDLGYLQLLPINEISDGFFIAKLKRMF